MAARGAWAVTKHLFTKRKTENIVLLDTYFISLRCFLFFQVNIAFFPDLVGNQNTALVSSHPIYLLWNILASSRVSCLSVYLSCWVGTGLLPCFGSGYFFEDDLKWQLSQNGIARLEAGRKLSLQNYTHLELLHWLPVDFKVQMPPICWEDSATEIIPGIMPCKDLCMSSVNIKEEF